MLEVILGKAITTPDGGSYMPVNLASLRLDTVTGFDIYLQPIPGQSFILYAERDCAFTERVRKRLIDNRVDRIYISTQDRIKYHKYLERNLAAIVVDPTVSIESKSDVLYATACGSLETVFDHPQAPEAVQQTRDIVKHSVGLMLEDRRILGCLLKNLSVDYRGYTHGVNTMTYAVSLAQRVGYQDPATLREIATGAILHDIGKSQIAPEIINSPKSLSQEQWALMKRHASYGYAIMAQQGHVGEIALDIILHHHERMRGTGYPDGLADTQISPFVRIVAIADIFDAITTHRPFQRGRSSFDALVLMRKQVSLDIDRDFFRTFVGMMGHPEG